MIELRLSSFVPSLQTLISLCPVGTKIKTLIPSQVPLKYISQKPFTTLIIKTEQAIDENLNGLIFTLEKNK